jgi:nucleoid-associated protein YgaU
MRTHNLERRRNQGSGWRALAGHVPLQVAVGAVAIAAIVLAFVFRAGESPQVSKASPTAARPTIAPAVVVTPPTQTPTPAPQQERIHVVAAGDTLTGIAQKYYGDASKWNKIFEANRDILPSSNSLQIGQKLKIPE